jgi:integrase/recombinase XerD
MRARLTTPEYKKLYQVYDRMVTSKGFKTGCGQMYQASLLSFLVWMEKRSITSISGITSKHVKKYLDYLITRPNERRGGTLSVSTINHNLFALRLFFNHLLDIGYAKEVVFIPNNLARNSQSHATQVKLRC